MDPKGIGDRLKEFRKSLSPKMSQTQFGASLGMSRDVYNNIEGGRLTRIPAATIKLICQTYTQLNPVWLELGTGEMLTSTEPDTLEQLIDDKLPNASPLTRAMLKMILTRPDQELKAIEKALLDLQSIYQDMLKG